jgi:hypothetical protein
MDGRDSDGAFVAFQAELKGVACALRIGGLLVEPLEEAGAAKIVFADGGVQDFGEVQQIGEAALAVGQCQEPGADAFPLEQRPEHREETLAGPNAGKLGKAIAAGLPGGVVRGGGLKLSGVETQRGGGERRL